MLAIALLREQQSNIRTISAVPGQKSDVIQKVCFLVAALNSVPTRDILYSLCRQYAAVLQRLLDSILEPAPNNSAPANTYDVSDVPPLDVFDFTLATTDHDTDFLHWLESLS
jgi:hypothetical protein